MNFSYWTIELIGTKPVKRVAIQTQWMSGNRVTSKGDWGCKPFQSSSLNLAKVQAYAGNSAGGHKTALSPRGYGYATGIHPKAQLAFGIPGSVFYW